MGWLRDWDSKNQLRAERDRELYGGDDWVERYDDDHDPGSAWKTWQRTLMAILVTLAVVGALVVLVRLVAAGV